MNQTLHIFRKDVRFLRIEIALMLLLTAGLALLPGELLSEIIALAALFLIVRLIHAEAIPGERQFWLTRPYRPMSLLGAKLLFIVVFICAPIAIAQALLVLRLGFPFGYELPGLLFTQFLIFFVVAVPVAAIASVTSRLVTFVVAVLVLVATVMFGRSGVDQMLPGHSAGTANWIMTALFFAAIACIAAIILYWQYRDRRTLFSQIFGLAIFYAALALLIFIPGPWLEPLQTWFSQQHGLTSNVRISVEPKRRDQTVSEGRTNTHIPLVFAVNGIPAGTEVRSDYTSISFVWPDKTWSPSEPPGRVPQVYDRNESLLKANVLMDSSLYRARSTQPVTIRGEAFLTLFGDPERRRVSLRNGPVNVQDGLQCFQGDFIGGNYLVCRSFFRWPVRLVTAEANTDITDFENSRMSYAPFPASLDLSPLDVRWAEPLNADEATIVTKKPLVHFRKEFELRNACLADWELPWPPPPFARPRESACRR
jgi:hypothetical protein